MPGRIAPRCRRVPGRSPARSPDSRITSYNVCYTKLLRLILTLVNCTSQNKEKQSAKVLINKSLILGIWTDGQTENATFEIDKDSIYYVDSFQKFKYQIFGDSILIKFDGFDNTSKIEKVRNNFV